MAALNKLIYIISRSRAAVARRAHNPKVGGSIPPFATNKPWYLFTEAFLFFFSCLESLLSKSGKYSFYSLKHSFTQGQKKAAQKERLCYKKILAIQT